MKYLFFIRLTGICLLALLLNIAQGQHIIVPQKLGQLVDQSFRKYPRVEEFNDMVRSGEIRVSLGKAGYWPVASGDISY
ncbi:MAG: hypothetical protein WCL00_15000, partial [Bacteroidota bacterium]